MLCAAVGSEDRGLVYQTDTDASVLTAIRWATAASSSSSSHGSVLARLGEVVVPAAAAAARRA
jgi:hypothetical protein